MSFSSDTKAELCQARIEKKCCAVAESYGVLLYCNTFSRQEIRIVTENRHFAERLPRLFRKTFGVDFDQFPSLEQPGKLAFVIDDPEKLTRWWGPHGFTNRIDEFDFRPGGDWRITMTASNGTGPENQMQTSGSRLRPIQSGCVQSWKRLIRRMP